jgi:hypothetical protein
MGIVIIMGHFGNLGILQRTYGPGGTVSAAIQSSPVAVEIIIGGESVHRICAMRADLKGMGLVCVDAPTHPRRGKLARAA